ncbi:hypothetical protein QJS10_CPB12g01049 [Acorus calamus]|uniref:Uncharacterized protein n=1 Tax=Acorus calamus TaxID=4465 RepID=A0AAV9DMC5_ACOCL|nr:hypothetical protein QJS10_CPB12g01049 [Acorus calamus]
MEFSNMNEKLELARRRAVGIGYRGWRRGEKGEEGGGKVENWEKWGRRVERATRLEK